MRHGLTLGAALAVLLVTGAAATTGEYSAMLVSDTVTPLNDHSADSMTPPCSSTTTRRREMLGTKKTGLNAAVARREGGTVI